MILFFPMAALFSVMLILIRMAKDNELTVLRSSGISTTRIIMPLLFLSLFSGGLSYFTNEKIVPWTNEISDKIIRNEISKKPPPIIKEDIIFKDPSNRFFHIKKINTLSSTMENITIIESTQDYPRITLAKKAFWNNFSWTLIEGVIHSYGPQGDLEFLDTFDEMTINVKQQLSVFYSKEKSAKEMDSHSLKQKISTLNKGGVNTRSLKVEYYLKQSIPMACFIFGLLGISLCISFVQSSKDWWGVIISIIIAVLSVGFYFFIMALCRALAKDSVISAFLGAWIPNIIYGAIAGGVAMYQCRHK
jgi:lipopolysaccharide export system permease protein